MQTGYVADFFKISGKMIYFLHRGTPGNNPTITFIVCHV